jgi:hypothetical protein
LSSLFCWAPTSFYNSPKNYLKDFQKWHDFSNFGWQKQGRPFKIWMRSLKRKQRTCCEEILQVGLKITQTKYFYETTTWREMSALPNMARNLPAVCLVWKVSAHLTCEFCLSAWCRSQVYPEHLTTGILFSPKRVDKYLDGLWQKYFVFWFTH